MLSRHWRLWLSFPSLALPPEEWLGFELVLPSGNMPLRVGAVSFELVESTAADRAAADMRRVGYPQSCAAAHDSSLCGGSLLEVWMRRRVKRLDSKKSADD